MLAKALRCRTCLKTFSCQRNLKDHVRKIHKAAKVYSCHHCGFSTKHKSALARHIEQRHITGQSQHNSEFYCETCLKSFSCQRYLNEHFRRIHSAAKVHSCHHCGFNTKFKSALASHIERRHISKIEGSSRDSLKPVVNCPICTFSCAGREKMIEHYIRDHDVTLDEQHLNFEDSGQFFKWKEQMEAAEVSHFVKSGGLRKRSKDLTQYYRCSRDGVFQMKGTGKRLLKMKGSIKMGGVCPASIKAVTDKATGAVSVTFSHSHVGHLKELGRLSLTKTERAEIASKLAAGIPVECILDEIGESAQQLNLQRLHLTTRKDIWNIRHSFGLGKSPSGLNKAKKAHNQGNDRTSSEAWIRKLVNDEPEAPRFYKPADNIVPSLEQEQEQEEIASEDPCTADDDEIIHELSSENDFNDKKQKLRMKFEELLADVQCDEHIDILWKALLPVKSSMDACSSLRLLREAHYH